jgi:CobQ/CobB/MinD/ParA nucleotide binding domain
MQSKGGVGKTTIASWLAQYLLDKKRSVVCFDADPGNVSFASIGALNANFVSLFNPDTNETDINALDTLMQAALTEKADVVIDGGAGSFRPFADYLIRMNIPAILADHGKDLIIHSVLVGEPSAAHTLNGLNALLEQIPAPARVMVWLNEFFGPVSSGDLDFVETGVYAQHQRKIAGVIRLPKQSRYFAEDVRRMLSANQTFSEAIEASFIIPAQRLVMVRRPIWDQLDNTGIAG